MSGSPDGHDVLRLFVAVDLADAARAAVLEEVDALRQVGADVRWVPAEQLHLTLKFVGDLAGGDVDALRAALRAVRVAGGPSRDAILEHGIIELGIAGLGRFPPAGKGAPRVFWAGFQGAGLAALEALARGVDDACAGLGIARERRGFTPHLTIGRVRSGRGLPALEALVAERGPRFAVPLPPVDAFRLYRSELRPAGAVHTVVEEYVVR